MICCMQSTIDMQMTAEDAKPKITKLPRNGPKEGQSMNSWLHGKKMGDADWEKKRNQAINEGRL